MSAMASVVRAHDEIRRVQVASRTINMLANTPPAVHSDVTSEFIKGVAAGYKMISIVLKLTSIRQLRGELEVAASKLTDASERESGTLAAYNIVIGYLERMGF